MQSLEKSLRELNTARKFVKNTDRLFYLLLALALLSLTTNGFGLV